MPFAYAGLAATVIGAGTSVAGSMQQGAAGAASAKYQAQIAQNNQVVAGQNADLARQQAEQTAGNTTQLGGMRIGAQRAAIGASGVAGGSGSALDVQAGTAEATQRQVQADLYSGAIKAYGYEVAGANYANQSGLDNLTATNASAAGNTQAFSSLLGGASSVASKWNDLQNSGAISFGGSATPSFADV